MGSRRGVRFCARLKLFNRIGAFFCNSVTPREASVRWVDPGRRRACASPFHINKFMMFFTSRFSCFKSSEELAPFVALDRAFRAPISTDVVQPQASKWADPKGRHPSPAREPRVGPEISRRLQENNVRSLPERVSSLFLTDGRQPFVPAASATPACFEPILRFPFFRGGTAVRRRSSARRHPATVRT